ncbi:coagulation factor X [Genypterus blacodes]|uniref:coagulation factor X n=1 Tax=Genypterus blacodes TaxID=154954 RepID=UPI003F775746
MRFRLHYFHTDTLKDFPADRPGPTMFWFHRVTFCLLLLHQAAAHADLPPVFLDDKAANQMLIRQKRANSFLEEVKQGNMERECIEERCSWEEAREIFEDAGKTNEFWKKYVDGDSCESMPCAHGGICKDGIGSYNCFCLDGYQGYNCETAKLELCENANGGCKHFCNVNNGNVQCSCADGYFLDSDDKSCYSNETFKCGAIFSHNTRTIFRYERPTEEVNTTSLNTTVLNTTSLNQPEINNVEHESLFLQNSNLSQLLQEIQRSQILMEEDIIPEMARQTRIVNGEECPPGECPWQALLVNEDDIGFCGGTILNQYIILTAAHCMNQSEYIYIIVGEFDRERKEGREAIHNVATIVTHRHYKPDTYHNDIALIKLEKPIKFTKYIIPACLPERDFAERVLMQQPNGLVSGFGRIGEGRQPSSILQRLSMPYVNRGICIESSDFRISTRMFCAGYDTEEKDACQGDSGGPHVTRYHDTYFVTGIVSWGEGCARKGKYGVYTQVSKYIRWIRDGIEALVPKEKSVSRHKRGSAPVRRIWA